MLKMEVRAVAGWLWGQLRLATATEMGLWRAVALPQQQLKLYWAPSQKLSPMLKMEVRAFAGWLWGQLRLVTATKMGLWRAVTLPQQQLKLLWASSQKLDLPLGPAQEPGPMLKIQVRAVALCLWGQLKLAEATKAGLAPLVTSWMRPSAQWLTWIAAGGTPAQQAKPA